MARLEGTEERCYRRWCKSKGLFCLKLSAFFRGWPDRTIFGPGGTVLMVEMKRKGGRVSLHQEKWISVLRKLGFPVEVCYSCDEAVAFTRRVLLERGVWDGSNS